VEVKNWLLAYIVATFSLLIATANEKSSLSQRMEAVISRYLPSSSPELIVRYAALLFTALSATAYTILLAGAHDPKTIVAGAFASTLALETFPGTTVNIVRAKRNRP
jgi:hypothetical protein